MSKTIYENRVDYILNKERAREHFKRWVMMVDDITVIRETERILDILGRRYFIRMEDIPLHVRYAMLHHHTKVTKTILKRMVEDIRMLELTRGYILKLSSIYFEKGDKYLVRLLELLATILSAIVEKTENIMINEWEVRCG